METVPDLLTVEEAARILRIGRTKAYSLTQEFRATGLGLPVVQIAGQLRVPRAALEEWLRTSIESVPASDQPDDSPVPTDAEDSTPPAADGEVVATDTPSSAADLRPLDAAAPDVPTRRSGKSRKASKAAKSAAGQLTLDLSA